MKVRTLKSSLKNAGAVALWWQRRWPEPGPSLQTNCKMARRSCFTIERATIYRRPRLFVKHGYLRESIRVDQRVNQTADDLYTILRVCDDCPRVYSFARPKSPIPSNCRWEIGGCVPSRSISAAKRFAEMTSAPVVDRRHWPFAATVIEAAQMSIAGGHELRALTRSRPRILSLCREIP
jgi:hypothetical protein